MALLEDLEAVGARPSPFGGTFVSSEANSMTIVPEDKDAVNQGMAIHANARGSVQGETRADARYSTTVQSKHDTPAYKSDAKVGETTVTRKVTARDAGTRAEFRDRYGGYPGRYEHTFSDRAKPKVAKAMAGVVMKQAKRDNPREELEKAA